MRQDNGFARRVRETLAGREMTRNQLVARSGLPVTTIYRLTEEGGKRRAPKPAQVDAIAAALRVRADWLRTGEGPREAPTDREMYVDAVRAAVWERRGFGLRMDTVLNRVGYGFGLQFSALVEQVARAVYNPNATTPQDGGELVDAVERGLLSPLDEIAALRGQTAGDVIATMQPAALNAYVGQVALALAMAMAPHDRPALDFHTPEELEEMQARTARQLANSPASHETLSALGRGLGGKR